MKKLFALILALAMLTCAATAMAEDAAPATPKYVFMFIGDGMGNPQVTATQYYLGALENPDSTIPVPAQLSFTDFENVGLMTTYDASSFCPDSASTATSMASGQKTLSGVINYNIDLTESFKIITEYAKEAGKKVGVISSVSLDHATPAAYYAKSESRGEYYDIAAGRVWHHLGLPGRRQLPHPRRRRHPGQPLRRGRRKRLHRGEHAGRHPRAEQR